MRVAYIFSTAGQTIDYILGDMILSQLEDDQHGVDVAGLFFFHDNTFALRASRGSAVGRGRSDEC